MTGAELEAQAARVRRFTDHGLHQAEAQALAGRLQCRDRDGDDRRVCLECSCLGAGGRCAAAAAGRLEGASRRLEPVPATLQRCEGFVLREGLL